jgi:hypothetical protein
VRTPLFVSVAAATSATRRRATTPSPIPTDYVSYLESLANDTCWGITAGLRLRFVVLTVKGRVLLFWDRTGLNQPDPTFDADFPSMLATVTFP